VNSSVDSTCTDTQSHPPPLVRNTCHSDLTRLLIDSPPSTHLPVPFRCTASCNPPLLLTAPHRPGPPPPRLCAWWLPPPWRQRLRSSAQVSRRRCRKKLPSKSKVMLIMRNLLLDSFSESNRHFVQVKRTRNQREKAVGIYPRKGGRSNKALLDFFGFEATGQRYGGLDEDIRIKCVPGCGHYVMRGGVFTSHQ
jgi:hypothetical protein